MKSIKNPFDMKPTGPMKPPAVMINNFMISPKHSPEILTVDIGTR
jgi:hypothetical protein